METPTINNYTSNDSHFTSEDRKTIFGLEFAQKQFSKDITEIKNDVREIKDGVVARIDILEKNYSSASARTEQVEKNSDERYKNNRVASDDHEKRLRRLELWGGIALGLSYALEFYFQFLKK